MNQTSPMVSVIMSVYNGGKFLPEAINSILNQTFNDFEFLIVNDASTDNTAAVLAEYATKDKRVRVLTNEKNMERSYSRNRAIKAAQSDLIAIMDADDISLPHRLERQFEFMNEYPDVGICGGYHETFGDQHSIWKGPSGSNDISIMLIFTAPFSHPTVMFRKRVLELHGLCYGEGLCPAEDYSLWVKMIQHCKAHNLSEVLLNYRWHGNNSSIIHYKKQMASMHDARLDYLQYIYGGIYSRQELELIASVFDLCEKKYSINEFEFIESFLSTLHNQILRDTDDSKDRLLYLISGVSKNLYRKVMWPVRWRLLFKSKRKELQIIGGTLRWQFILSTLIPSRILSIGKYFARSSRRYRFVRSSFLDLLICKMRWIS